MTDQYRNEDVLKYAREAFAETIALKVQQLRKFVPKKKDETNTDLTGSFIEELVRGFIQKWIGHRQLVHGTLYNAASATSGDKALQIDGIVHDPRKGPPTISEGSFEIVHPAFCAGVIEIKTTVSSITEFVERLKTIHGRYMHHLSSGRVMGVVVADADPAKESEAVTGKPLFSANEVGLCPVFILFKETEGEYVPYFPAIDAMIKACHQLHETPNYL